MSHRETSDPKQPRYWYNEIRKRALDDFHQLLIAPPEELVKSCLNCDNFHEQSEICKRFQQRPPARIIAYSCACWENVSDQIPF